MYFSVLIEIPMVTIKMKNNNFKKNELIHLLDKPNINTNNGKFDEIQKFFYDVLIAFEVELELIASKWFKNAGNKDLNNISDLFEQVERCYVGIFCNSIKRAFPDDAVLQEFSVYKGKFHLGWADLLAHHKGVDILFESKRWDYDGEKTKIDTLKNYYGIIINQAKEYFLAEKDWYKNPTYLAALVFETIKNKSDLEKVKKNQEKDGLTDFSCLYYSAKGGFGLMVYGKVEKQ